MQNNRIIHKLYICLLFAVILVHLTACDASTVSPYSPGQMAEVIISSQSSAPVMRPLLMDDDNFAEYISNIYQIEINTLNDGAVYYADGIEASEIAILHLVDDADIEQTEELLSEYIKRRTAVFAGYAPSQAALVESGLIAVRGNFIALLICGDSKKAKLSFLACFGGNPPLLANTISKSTGFPTTTAKLESAEFMNAIVKAESTEFSDTAAESESTVYTAITAEAVAVSNPDGAAAEPPDAATSAATVVSSAGDVTPDVTSGTGEPPPDANKTPEFSKQQNTSSSKAADTLKRVETSDSTKNNEDAYNAQAILTAWRGGDRTALSVKNKRILDACTNVIATFIEDSMTDYQKELTVHDWIVRWTDYDEEAASNAPDARPDPDNANPYGLLINQKATCKGYTSAFQLFMDMLDIECISVTGTGNGGISEHSWNMVRLDGEWYCVDVTWDDPTGSEEPKEYVRHDYFNVTSRFMRNNNHNWDKNAVPEATSTAAAYRGFR